MTGERPRNVPDGFELTHPRGPFTALNGPIWRKPGAPGDPPAFGLLPEARHTNGLGFVHGGMVATFLDSAMAQAIFETFSVRLVTLELKVSYLHVAMKGRWCEARIALDPREENRVTAQADMISRGQVCARAEGVFQLFP